jgi:hypothetical protein
VTPLADNARKRIAKAVTELGNAVQKVDNAGSRGERADPLQTLGRGLVIELCAVNDARQRAVRSSARAAGGVRRRTRTSRPIPARSGSGRRR